MIVTPGIGLSAGTVTGTFWLRCMAVAAYSPLQKGEVQNQRTASPFTISVAVLLPWSFHA